MALVEERFVSVGGRGLVVAAGLVDRTAIARLAETLAPDFLREQHEIGNVVSMEAVAETTATIVNDSTLTHGHVAWLGAPREVLLAKYPAEAA